MALSNQEKRNFTMEHRKKLSISHQGQHSSPATEFKKGYKFSNEVERQRIESLTGREFSQKHKDNISKGKMGHPVSEESIEKMKQAHKDYLANHIHPMKGKQFNKEARKNMSRGQKLLYASGYSNLCIGKKGEGNPAWKNGLSREPYPLEWRETLKESIRQRDGYQCQLCGCSQVENIQRLSIHHIDYNKKNLNLNNLISLCKKCHSKVNFNREEWEKFFKEAINGVKFSRTT